MKKLILLGLILFSSYASVAYAETPHFSSYDQAVSYVQENYKADVINPTSKAIYRAEYYPADGEGFLIIYFQSNPSKGYIYRGVPEEVWREFKSADSKGKFYNAYIKGRYRFNLG